MSRDIQETKRRGARRFPVVVAIAKQCRELANLMFDGQL